MQWYNAMVLYPLLGFEPETLAQSATLADIHFCVGVSGAFAPNFHIIEDIAIVSGGGPRGLRKVSGHTDSEGPLCWFYFQLSSGH